MRTTSFALLALALPVAAAGQTAPTQAFQEYARQHAHSIWLLAEGENPRQFQNGTTVPTIASLPATPTSSFEETKKIPMQKALLASLAVELKLPLISPDAIAESA